MRSRGSFSVHWIGGSLLFDAWRPLWSSLRLSRQDAGHKGRHVIEVDHRIRDGLHVTGGDVSPVGAADRQKEIRDEMYVQSVGRAVVIHVAVDRYERDDLRLMLRRLPHFQPINVSGIMMVMGIPPPQQS